MRSPAFMLRFIYFLIAICCLAAKKESQSSLRDIFKLEIDKDLQVLKALEPNIIGMQSKIMFWRPQKAGTSTILSILLSYSFRYNVFHRRRGASNSFCRKIALCSIAASASSATNNNKNSNSNSTGAIAVSPASMTPLSATSHIQAISAKDSCLKPYLKQLSVREKMKESYSEIIDFHIVASHQICNLPNKIVAGGLQCAFTVGVTSSTSGTSSDANPVMKSVSNMFRSAYEYFSPAVTAASTTSPSLPSSSSSPPSTPPPAILQLFAIRDPLARSISAYYFWGELYKMKASGALAIGSAVQQKSFLGEPSAGRYFSYHGNESTAPPEDYALDYANRLPLRAGMHPGPSLTWSLFSDSVAEAVVLVKSDTIMTLVLERFDQSLVVASHYLNWTLADVVVASARKSLSSHPPASQWPTRAVDIITNKLNKSGEYAVYNAAVDKLDRRIAHLSQQLGGKDRFDQQVSLLQEMRKRVSESCMSTPFLQRYRSHLRDSDLRPYLSHNKLRDASASFVNQGHEFNWNGEILFSYDICANCEAHALLLGHQKSPGADIWQLPMLQELPEEDVKNNVHFKRCPVTV